MPCIEVVVAAIQLESDGVQSFELRSVDRSALPVFTAGSHIEVQMSPHLARSYSLANDPDETHRYVIAVHKDPAGRGGSLFMQEKVRVGQRLRISEPRNNFELNEAAPHSVLIAGGIGITPLRAMIARLQRLRRPWTLYYCGRQRGAMAYLDEFDEMRRAGRDVRVHVDCEHDGAVLDLAAVVRSAPAGAHMYCCGPKPMLAAFESATLELPSEQVHVEYFSAKEAAAAEGGFRVELARSGRVLLVEPGKTILDAVLDAGLDVDYSCREGICGSCQVGLLAGVPDHRDAILSKEERDANDRLIICCSGAKSASLTLDL
jgi:vanillate O-demethylase ferredoxin subunit